VASRAMSSERVMTTFYAVCPRRVTRDLWLSGSSRTGASDHVAWFQETPPAPMQVPAQWK